MTTIEDAWTWYTSVKRLSKTMLAMGKNHWNGLPWDGPLGRDDRLKEVQDYQIVDWANAVESDIDDLGILVLFSVFEAIVREKSWKSVAAELEAVKPNHRMLLKAIEELEQNVIQGSFARVTDCYKNPENNDMVEQVNQVRRYRNWVAHGRRGDPPDQVDPKSAYDRLQRFLTLIG